MLKINGVEFEIDINDLDVSEKIEEQMNLVLEKIHNANPKTRTEGIKEVYNVVANCFNKVLGKGAADKIFKGKKNMMFSLKCFEEFATTMQEADINTGKELEKMKNKYSPNRAQRRDNNSHNNNNSNRKKKYNNRHK